MVVDSLILEASEIRTDPGITLGRFVEQYSKKVQCELLLGNIPIEPLAEMVNSYDPSLINQPELPLEVRMAYRDLAIYFKRAIKNPERTRVSKFLRARHFYDSVDKRFRMIHRELKRDTSYLSQRTRRAVAS